jgi:hypothetical protein
MGRFRMRTGFLPKLSVAPQMTAAMLAGAKFAAEEAKRIAPVLTGSYRDSIRAEVVEGKAKVIADDMAAGFIEFGTEDTPTFAPLRRAAEAIFGTGKLRG